ncbi:MAG: transposase, partial [Thermoanaerobaculia bacterium]
MSREIRADYDQQHLFPRSLEEWVPEDHPARFLREFVDSLDLSVLGFRERESVEGRPSYAPDLLLKVWLYGYVHKIRSTRALERACREHVSLLWLTGCHEPDHNTLWRFWRDNQEALRRVFGEVVKVSVKAGVVETVLHAVDGTKVRSRGSARSAWHRKDLERLSREVAEFLEETEAAIEQAEERERGEYRLPEELRDREALRQRIQEALDELAEEDREHLHPAEPEAQMMKCEGQAAFA